MVTTTSIKGFECHCASNQDSTTVCYLIYPALVLFEDKWLQRMSEELKVTLVAVYVPADDWNNMLTPWAAPGEAKGYQPFKGEATEFLSLLQDHIIPEVEKENRFDNIKGRDLLGVSLGGLFTLWQWLTCDTFRNIACLSGSFWYEGFMKWFATLTIPAKTGEAYFLLGDEEPKSHIKAYQSVGVNTEKIVESLKEAGIKTEFQWVPGNHFSRHVHRAEKALQNLYDKH